MGAKKREKKEGWSTRASTLVLVCTAVGLALFNILLLYGHAPDQSPEHEHGVGALAWRAETSAAKFGGRIANAAKRLGSKLEDKFLHKTAPLAPPGGKLGHMAAAAAAATQPSATPADPPAPAEPAVTARPAKPAALDEGEFPAAWLENNSLEDLRASEAQAEHWGAEAKEAITFAFGKYHERAWGSDEIRPVSGGPGRSWVRLGVTIIDSLSTLWMAGVMDEFEAGVQYVSNMRKLIAGDHGLHSFFELTIRVIGGLASAHALSGRQELLDALILVADKMMPAFGGGPWPKARINLGTGQSGWNTWTRGAILAEVGSIQMEFRYITQVTGDPKYQQAVDRAMDNVIKASGSKGIIGDLLKTDSASSASTHLTMGAMADSYYEYLLKLWIQTGKHEDKYKDQWKVAMRDLQQMVGTTRSGLMFVGEFRNAGGKLNPKMEHLACFIAGNLKLGSETLPADEVEPQWAAWAKGITAGCHAMYSRTETGLGPEYAMFRPDSEAPADLYIEKAGQHYLLRPEVLESIYYMHYFTGDPKYREWTHNILLALNKYARAQWGYTSIKNVQSASMGSNNFKDEEESFLFAETLKYIYLTLSPHKTSRAAMDLSKWVFNTEAHPLPIVDATKPLVA